MSRWWLIKAIAGHLFPTDTVSAVTVEIISTNGDNLFAYCENSPVCFEDSNGQYVETPYDIVTLEICV